MKNQDSKKLSTPTLIGILLIVAAAFFFASGMIMFFATKNNDTKENKTTSSASQTAISQTDATEEAFATVEETEPQNEPDRFNNITEPQQIETVPKAPYNEHDLSP